MIKLILTRFKRFKKFIFPLSRKKIIILIILALLATGGVVAIQKSRQTQTLQFTQVKKQNIKSVVSASGTLNGKNTTDLKFRNSGKLAYLNVKVGDSVWAGQNIAGLDTQDLSIKLQQAQNTLADKQAQLDKIYDDLKGHASDETYAQRQTRTTAEVAKNNAYDSVREAERALEDSLITAPYSGVVTQVKVVAGQSVSVSDTIATISDTGEIYFDTDVDQADISKVKLDQAAEITLDSFPNKTFKSKVSAIQGQTKTTGNNATVILVRIKLLERPSNFISGLTGQVSITVEEAKNTLSLPLEAIREDNTVVLQTAGRLRPQKIEVGIKSDTDAEIKSGLTEGERVVLNPPANLNFRNQNRNPLFRFIRLR